MKNVERGPKAIVKDLPEGIEKLEAIKTALDAIAAGVNVQVGEVLSPPELPTIFKDVWYREQGGYSTGQIWLVLLAPDGGDAETFFADEVSIGSRAGAWVKSYLAWIENLQAGIGSVALEMFGINTLRALLGALDVWFQGAKLLKQKSGQRRADGPDVPRIGVGAKQTEPQNMGNGKPNRSSAKRAADRMARISKVANNALLRALGELQRATSDYKAGKISAAKHARIRQRAERRTKEARQARQQKDAARRYLTETFPSI